ncbi:MAG: hypothetical protein AN482_13390 [Anabaena sp. LE011-02]|jgi:hypothetical protein|nr:MAG: hypothetical protein AN482_13390 [Anabaena sp. LE011-02]
MNKIVDALKRTAYTGLVAGSLILATSPAKSAELGGLNLDGFCRSVYGSNARSYLIRNLGASGWRCLVNNRLYEFTGPGKDMHAACKWQYRRQDAMAQLYNNNWSDAYAWRCYGQGRLIR